jgi:uncharacterized 2Fe-2S/4Fe-4S cluster protein (DUF4445 family)
MREFLLVPAVETQTGVDITLTKKDIRAVQLAKGALLAGITLVCREAAIDLPRRLCIAGCFGGSVNVHDAVTICMLPRLPDCAFDAVGNAASDGAILALLDRAVDERAATVARRTRVVDLGAHRDFQEVFVNSLGLPGPGGNRK